MIERIAVGVAIARPDGAFEHANRYLREVFETHGISPVELPRECLGGSPAMDHGGRWQPGAAELDCRAVRLRGKKGKMVDFLHAVYPLYDETGVATRFVHVLQSLGDEGRVETLSRLAFYDSLTGLPNRNLFNDRLGRATATARRNGSAFALLCIDIDHFKRINDAFGHEAGDEVLREVAARLAGSLRSSDTVARWGGDEFVAIVEGVADRDAAAAIASKLLDACDNPYAVRGRGCRITLSIGASLYPRDGKDTATLFERADRAMYEVKARGRAGYHILEDAHRDYLGAA